VPVNVIGLSDLPTSAHTSNNDEKKCDLAVTVLSAPVTSATSSVQTEVAATSTPLPYFRAMALDRKSIGDRSDPSSLHPRCLDTI